METPRPDADEIKARIEAANAAADAALKARRAELLERLRAAEIARIEAHYDGYGDSGNVHEITGGMEDDLEEAVAEFVWDFAYGRHPGFENNEGGQGTLTWDIVADSIALDHGDNYIEIERTREEGL